MDISGEMKTLAKPSLTGLDILKAMGIIGMGATLLAFEVVL